MRSGSIWGIACNLPPKLAAGELQVRAGEATTTRQGSAAPTIGTTEWTGLESALGC
jgi:hypothetical protein